MGFPSPGRRKDTSQESRKEPMKTVLMGGVSRKILTYLTKKKTRFQWGTGSSSIREGRSSGNIMASGGMRSLRPAEESLKQEKRA